MSTDETGWREAERLNGQGRVSAEAGDWDAALSLYQQAASRAPAFEPAWFNMALVHKRRRQWDQAIDCNERAAALDGAQGDPAWWNLGIAATALRRWDVARRAWQRFGIQVPDGPGELQMDLGPAPVRIDPDGRSEVVWGRRVDPARIVIENVPTPESGHRWGDVVLHDGAPNGEGWAWGQRYGVIDELERWQPSASRPWRSGSPWAARPTRRRWRACSTAKGTPPRTGQPPSGCSAGGAAKGSRRTTMSTRRRPWPRNAHSASPHRWTAPPGCWASGRPPSRAVAGTATRLLSGRPGAQIERIAPPSTGIMAPVV